jgi:uncharacterized membrane-anchored protein
VSKVPVVTIWFWLIKVMISGADVAWPDYLGQHLGVFPTGGALGLGLVVALAAQFRAQRYRAWVFWAATVAVSTVGTDAANGPHTVIGLSYPAVALLYLVVLVALAAWWRASTGTMSLRQIDTMPREAFFWAATLASCALGRAILYFPGLLLQNGSPDPYLLLFWTAVTGCMGLAWRFGLNPNLAFWSCCVLTRPLGTSVAFCLAGELGTTTGIWAASTGLAAGFVVSVSYLAVSHRDVAAPDLSDGEQGINGRGLGDEGRAETKEIPGD